MHRGFVLIQDGGDRSPMDFWVHLAHCYTLINLGHGFKKANGLILRCQ